MYETPEENDGYKALKLCLEKFNPKCSAFFQYPKPNVRPEDEVWFEAIATWRKYPRKNDEKNQRSSRAVKGLYKSQHQCESHNPVVQSWCA